MDSMRGFGSLLGRFLMGMIFILAGLQKLMNPAATAAVMGQNGIPLPGLLVYLTILVELGGGLILIAGFYTRQVAFLLFLFLIPTTLIFHTGPEMMQRVNLLKNCAIMGGLLMVAVNGGGGWSVDSATRSDSMQMRRAA